MEENAGVPLIFSVDDYKKMAQSSHIAPLIEEDTLLLNNILYSHAGDLIAGAMLNATWHEEEKGKRVVRVENLQAAKKNKCF